MEQNQNTPQPKRNVKSKNLFVLLIGFFLIIRGGMRIAEGDTLWGISMLVTGIFGVVYYFLKR